MKRIILALAIFISFFAWVNAKDYYVDGVNGSNSQGDGSQGMPWKSITYSLAQVTTGAEVHTIHAAAAVYDTTLETFPIMMKNKVSLVGAGRDVTILDAKGTETVIECKKVADTRTRIEGFTVTGGQSKMVSGGYIRGGGIQLEASSPTIINNIIIMNRGGQAGGIMCVNISSPTIEGNAITKNYGSVGGIHTSKYPSPSNPIIKNNLIEGNRGSVGGIECDGSYPLIEGNTIKNDTTYSSGGGAAIRCKNAASPRIIGNTISENVGASVIQLDDSSPVIERNVISNNLGPSIKVTHFTASPPIGPTIVNNTFDGNSSDAIVVTGGPGENQVIPLVKNNIISNNSGYGISEGRPITDVLSVQFNLFFNNTNGHYEDEGTKTYTSVALMDSLIQECRWNMEGDPMFADAANGNYQLLPGSPAIDAGAHNSPLDPDGSRADIGALPFFDTSDAPGMPRNLRAVPGNTQVSLTWSANIEPDLAYYAIYRSQSSGFTPSPGDSIAKVIAPDTTYLDSGLTNGATYYYRICAVDSTWKKSDFTAELSATPHEVTTWHYYVDDSGVNAPERGAQSNPWKTITFALSRVSATGGDDAVVHVGQGTYTRALGEVFPIIVKNKVSLIGAGANSTILDAGGIGRVIKCVAISDTATRVEGFTIRNGSNSSGGGGLFITAGSALTIANNIITANKAPVTYVSTSPKSELGGGIYILNSSPKILSNIISDNWVGAAALFKTGSGGWGGGIAIFGDDSAPVISNNVISGNRAINTAFATAFGGGIYIGGKASPTILKNTITGNSLRQLGATSGPTRGGGIYLGGQATAIIAKDSIANNTASAMYGSVSACAGIFIDSSYASITNNIIAQNDFGGIHLSVSSPKIVNNTIVYNQQDGIYLSNVSVPTIINTILAFNTRDGVHEDSYGDDPNSVAYNLFYSNESSLYFDEGNKLYYNVATLHTEAPECSNNMEGDPLFVDAANGDYHLPAGSPAKNAGHPDAKYNDPDGSRSDIGAYGGPGATGTEVVEHPRDAAAVPGGFSLSQNYPNPFNPVTSINYQLPKQTEVRLQVYNILGELVKTLVDKKQPAGYYRMRWNGKDEYGRSVASGVYLYSLRAGEFVQVRKMLFVQ